MKHGAKIYAELFLAFAKVGLFTFGGGYAMISLIAQTCVEEKGWITHDEMATMTAIAESTPGPIAINSATYVGWRQAGIAGALAATAGMVAPSFIILYVISMWFNRFLEIAWIASAFKGIKIGVGVLILQAGVNMLRNMKKKPLSVGLAAFGVAATAVTQLFALRISTVVILLAAALISVALSGVRAMRGKGERA